MFFLKRTLCELIEKTYFMAGSLYNYGQFELISRSILKIPIMHLDAQQRGISSPHFYIYNNIARRTFSLACVSNVVAVCMRALGIASRGLGFADYHLNVFALSWPRARRAGGLRTSKEERKPRTFAEESLFLASPWRSAVALSFFLSCPARPVSFLSHSVGIVTLTYEDRGIRFLCGPYCLLFRLFASRGRPSSLIPAYVAVRFYSRRVHRVLGSNIADLSDARYARRERLTKVRNPRGYAKDFLQRPFRFHPSRFRAVGEVFFP